MNQAFQHSVSVGTPRLVKAEWSHLFDADLPGPSALKGSRRHCAYPNTSHQWRKTRLQWEARLRTWILGAGIPRPLERRAVHLIRLVSPTMRRRSDVGIRDAIGPVMDALYYSELVLDRSSRWLELHLHQEETDGEGGVLVRVESQRR